MTSNLLLLIFIIFSTNFVQFLYYYNDLNDSLSKYLHGTKDFQMIKYYEVVSI